MSARRATVSFMSELDDLRAEVAHLRDLVGAADMDSMETKDLLKHQTRLISALRETQNGMNKVLGEQGEALAGMVLAVNGVQERVSAIDKRVITMAHNLTGLDNRVTSMDGRVTSVDGRLATLEGQVGSIDQNVAAILRHLGA
jgi:chromosome segregation ATPase